MLTIIICMNKKKKKTMKTLQFLQNQIENERNS